MVRTTLPGAFKQAMLNKMRQTGFRFFLLAGPCANQESTMGDLAFKGLNDQHLQPARQPMDFPLLHGTNIARRTLGID
jgi:hypothetical protein